MIPHKNRKIGDRLWSNQVAGVFNPISFYNQTISKLEVGWFDSSHQLTKSNPASL